MAAVLVETAEAVAEALNDAAAGTFNEEFEAVRSYADWDLPLEKSSPLDGRVLVDVVPVPPVETELETRGYIGYKPAIDIIVRKRLNPDQRDPNGRFLLAEIDALVLFVESLTQFFTETTLSNNARWSETEIRRFYVPAHLHKEHQFTGMVRVTFDHSDTEA